MKVYIVTSGEYSSYSIEAVFTNKKQAQLYAATHSDDYMYCSIETWDSDETKIDTSVQVKNRWFAVIAKNGEIKTCYVRYETIEEKEDSIIEYNSGAHVHVTLDKDIKKGQAVKIILDRVAARRYRRMIELEG